MPIIAEKYKTTSYIRAISAVPELTTLEYVVEAFGESESPVAAAWSTIKQLVVPFVGTQRGYIPQNASDTVAPLDGIDGEALLNLPEPLRIEATSDTEKWLRTTAAFDAVTSPWLAHLYDMEEARKADAEELAELRRAEHITEELNQLSDI